MRHALKVKIDKITKNKNKANIFMNLSLFTPVAPESTYV